MTTTYKIGEAASALNLKTYVLRFWETEFPQIAPLRTEKGQRMYTQEHVALLARIRYLLHERGLTIEGARKALAEEAASGTVYSWSAAPPLGKDATTRPEALLSSHPAHDLDDIHPLTEEERHFLTDETAALYSEELIDPTQARRRAGDNPVDGGIAESSQYFPLPLPLPDVNAGCVTAESHAVESTCICASLISELEAVVALLRNTPTHRNLP